MVPNSATLEADLSVSGNKVVEPTTAGGGHSRVVSLYYHEQDGQPPKMYAVLRTPGGKRLAHATSSVLPHCFVRAEDANRIDHLARWAVRTEPFGDHVRVSFLAPRQVREFRERCRRKGIETFQADVPFARVYRFATGTHNVVDRELKPAAGPVPPLRKLFIDIETVEDRIDAIGCMGDDGAETWIRTGDEAKNIERFVAFAAPYDLLIAWYGDHFDFPLLQKAAQRNGLRIAWEFWQTVDLLYLYKRARGQERSTWDLGSVGKEELKLDKFRAAFRSGKSYADWDDDARRAYNMRDVEIIKKLDEKLGLVELETEISDIAGLPVGECYPSAVVESLVLRKGLARGTVFPNKQAREEEPYEGAVVLAPAPGLHENVVALDFSRMYASIIRTFNIGPDTLSPDGDIRGEVGRYVLSKRSIFAEVLDELVEARERHKRLRDHHPPDSPEWRALNIRQNAYKVIANALYGVLGFRNSRFYRRELASEVPAIGRFFLTKTREILEAVGCRVIYGDTDGLFYVPGAATPPPEEIVATLNSIYGSVLAERGVPEQWRDMRIEFRETWQKIFFTDAKKRYAGIDSSGRLRKAGFELLRSDWCDAARHLQETILGHILNGQLQFVEEYIRLMRKDVLKGAWNDHLILSSSIRRDLGEYKNVNAPHVAVARKLGCDPRTMMGKVHYVITDYHRRQVVEPVVDGKVPEITERGLRYNWNRKVYPPTERILRAAGLDLNPEQFYVPVRGGRETVQKTLDAASLEMLGRMGESGGQVDGLEIETREPAAGSTPAPPSLPRVVDHVG